MYICLNAESMHCLTTDLRVGELWQSPSSRIFILYSILPYRHRLFFFTSCDVMWCHSLCHRSKRVGDTTDRCSSCMSVSLPSSV